jgi:hypothetical protein
VRSYEDVRGTGTEKLNTDQCKESFVLQFRFVIAGLCSVRPFALVMPGEGLTESQTRLFIDSTTATGFR